MLSRIAGRMILLALTLVQTSAGLSQSERAPQAAPHSEINDLISAREWYEKGDAAERAGNKQEALRDYQESAKAYRRIISRDPNNTSLWKRLGSVCWLAGQKEEAIAAYRQAISLKPDDHESYEMLGNIQLSNPDAAIAAYREAIRLNPINANYQMDLGSALSLKGDLDGAIGAFQEAARLNPEDGECHVNLGGILQKKGDNEGAISEYRKSLRLKLSESSASKTRQLLAIALAAQKPISESYVRYWRAQVVEWRAAAASHSPGKSDEAAVTIGSWPTEGLKIVLDTVKRSQSTRNNAELKLGALLHTDIALLNLETGAKRSSVPQMAFFSDGRAVSVIGGLHWSFARQLLNSVFPRPSHDGMVRQWYIATTGGMLNRRLLAYADPNLKSALQIFPSDASILFYAGILHETYAAPMNQNVLRSDGSNYLFASRKSELELARQFFQKSIAADPGLAEAHLHFGRVLGLLGRHDEAAIELRQASSSLADPVLLYYASLFLGHEQAMLGRETEAKAHYEKAAKLFPAAQSPLLALSQLARAVGDSQSALMNIQKVFELPAGHSQTDDPWWYYDLASVRNADTLLSGMREAFGGLPR